MNPIVLIPARMAATRLPGKPLADIEGLPMIVRVLKQAEADKRFAKLVAKKAERVLAMKKKSKALKKNVAPAPKQKTVERLTRGIWRFSEELRMRVE